MSLRPDDPADEELARDAQAGSSTAFEQLVYRYEKRMYAFLFHQVGSVADAEDLTQQTLVNAYRALDRFDPTRRFDAWVFTIARRLAASHWRRRGAALAGKADVADTRTPASVLAERETEQNVWAWARQELSRDQFSALWLQVQEDLPIKAIAMSLGRTQGSVKVLLHRARRRLLDVRDAKGHTQTAELIHRGEVR